MNGATHTEIKIVNGDIYLIEINARPGGDHIAHPLTMLSTGYDYLTFRYNFTLKRINIFLISCFIFLALKYL